MKSFITNLAKFLAFCGFVYFLLLIVHGGFIPRQFRGNLFKYDDGFDYSLTRLNELDSVKNIDVLIMGSSHAYRGYDVRKWRKKGLNAFNMGTSAQTLLQTEYLFNRYLHQLKPKMVIIDVYPTIFNNDGLESTLQLLSLLPTERELIDMALNSRDILAYHSLIFYAVRNAFPALFPKMKDKKDKENTYIKGGYVESHAVGGIYSRYNNTKIIFSHKQQNSLQNMVDSLKKYKIQYYIFQSPISAARYKAIQNNPEIDKKLSTYGKYYNFNEHRILPDSCFIDNNHVNAAGVEVYDKYIFDEIDKDRYKGTSVRLLEKSGVREDYN